MKNLNDASMFLYLDTPALHHDFELMKEFIAAIPKGMLRMHPQSYPVISDFAASLDAPHYYILIGYGYHYSDFRKKQPKPSGISFHLNPPQLPNPQSLQNVVMCGFTIGSSTFTYEEHQYFITNYPFNLDKVTTRLLDTGEIYKKK